MVQRTPDEGAYGGPNRKFLATPLGWAFANIMYETTREPIDPNSFKGLVFLYLWHMRQDAEIKSIIFQGHATMSAGAGDGSGVAKTAEDYMQAKFPFLKTAAKEQEEKLSELLNSQYGKAYKLSKRGMPKRKKL